MKGVGKSIIFPDTPARAPLHGAGVFVVLWRDCAGMELQQEPHRAWREPTSHGRGKKEQRPPPKKWQKWDSRCSKPLTGVNGCRSSPEWCSQSQSCYIKGWGAARPGLDGRNESNYRMKGTGRGWTYLVWSKSPKGFKAGTARRGCE